MHDNWEMSLGLLVYGDNHLILRGLRPTAAEALAIAAHFGLSVARIAPQLDVSGRFAAWQISVSEFRENLNWAVVLPNAATYSPAVSHLLEELATRGIVIDLIQETSCAV